MISSFRCLLLLAMGALAGSSARADQAADFVNAYLKKKQIPGCAVMVRKDGKVVLSAGYGSANLEHDVKVTPKTVFQSGSIGKQFTAMAVMMLAEEGKLSLGDPLSKFLEVPSSWSKITIRHLLTHTSGLGDYPESFSLQKDCSEEELLKMVTAQPLQFEPGGKWSYSNLGYVTLGLVIRKVTGEFYGDVLQKRIFRPLGMTDTRIISEEDIILNRAAGYRLKEGALKNQKWVAPSLNTTADGSLYLTVEDMAKWDEALENQKLISPAGFKQMWTPVKLNDGSEAPYGFGWSLGKNALGHPLMDHGGAWQGFATYIGRHPDEHLSVVVFCNRAGASPAYIANVVAGFFVPGLAPRSHAAIKVEPALLHSYAGEYRLDDRLTLKLAVVGDRLETTWLGQPMILAPESETIVFEEDSNRTLRFVKDGSGKVTGAIISVPEELTLRRLP
ncbi:MAG TPA: serine hydrolase domain-containing protein [Chthoniobacterales bacterium]